MTSNFITKIGLALGSNELASELLALASGINGKILAQIKPTTKAKQATAAIWSETFKVRLVDTDGNLHTWASQTQTAKVTIADTSTAGTATLGSANLVFVNGEATVVVNGNSAAWIAGDTVTVTVASLTVNGVTVTGGTYVITFTA